MINTDEGFKIKEISSIYTFNKYWSYGDFIEFCNLYERECKNEYKKVAIELINKKRAFQILHIDFIVNVYYMATGIKFVCRDDDYKFAKNIIIDCLLSLYIHMGFKK